jgi:hypothetical protein
LWQGQEMIWEEEEEDKMKGRASFSSSINFYELV